jgi:hypothetical protein
MRSRGLLFFGAAFAGLAAGWFLGQRHLVRSRSDLFSSQPLRRLSALGYLQGQEEVDTVRLLRDYLSWESQPMLRRRAEGILRRMESTLATAKAGG